MLLNYLAPRIAPNIVAAPTSNLDINSILGLSPSKYSGLQSVGNTGYYYGNNRMYEPYTSSNRYSNKLSILGTPAAPKMTIIGVPTGGYGTEEGTISRGSQSFRPVNVDITGFSKTKIGDSNIYEYSPSMAYIYSQMRPQITAQPNVMALNVPGYQQATGQMLSSPMATGSGAGRFLNTGNLLGFNFTPAQTTP